MDIFVYGTLTDSERVAELLSEWCYRGEAVLDGLHRVDGQYPTLLPGGQTDGRILSTPEIDALDQYEGVDTGLYIRATVSRTGGDTIEVYVGNPDRLGVAAEWPGTGEFSACVREYLRSAKVVVREQ